MKVAISTEWREDKLRERFAGATGHQEEHLPQTAFYFANLICRGSYIYKHSMVRLKVLSLLCILQGGTDIETQFTSSLMEPRLIVFHDKEVIQI